MHEILLRDYDFICLCETWLQSGDPDIDNLLPNYSCVNKTRHHRNRRPKRGSGGILLFIHKDINRYVEVIDSTAQEDRIWLQIHVAKEKKIIFCCFAYMPSADSVVTCNEASQWSTLEREVAEYTMQGDVILCGDLNARVGNLLDYIMNDSSPHIEQYYSGYESDNAIPQRKNQDVQTNTQGKRLINLCISSGIRILNGRHNGDPSGKFTCYTPRGCSVVDYVVMSENLLYTVEEFSISDLPVYSDHCTLHFAMNIPLLLRDDLENQKNEQTILIRPLRWNEQSKLILYQQNITEIEKLCHQTNTASPNSIATSFQELIIKWTGVKNKTKTRNKYFPRNSWFDRECKLEKTKLNKLKKAFLQNPTAETRAKFYSLRRDYKKLTKHKKALAQTKLHNKLLQVRCNDPKTFWKIIGVANKKPTKHSVDAYKLYCHFKSLHECHTMIPTTCQQNFTVVPELDDVVTYTEVLQAIKKTKSGKTAGEDGIPMELYKNIPDQVLHLVTCIFNRILMTQEFPEAWARGLISPIHKSGDKRDPKNYRGITLLNTLGKIFTAILLNRLSEWTETCGILPEEQYGFRPNRRTTDCIFILNTLIEKTKADNSTLFVCFVDLKKAFDNIQHSLLWTKLQSIGVSSKIIKTLQSMYDNATARVKLSSYEASKSFKCSKGVRKGCNLSPLLFNLFLKGLEVKLADNQAGVPLGETTIDTIMFADDIILLSTCIEGIRKHIKTMEHFCHKWNLAINTEKTKVCTFGTRRHHCVLCQNTPLENVNSYKYLGVWISKNGKFTKSKTTLCLQAKKVVFGLKRAIAKLKSPPVQVSLHLYNTIVRPFLCYGCEVWGFHSDPNIERVEMDYIKYILHLPAKATNSAA